MRISTPSATCWSRRRTASICRCASSQTIQVSKGASFIYRESNSRFIGVQFSVTGRDLASAVQDARERVAAAVPLPTGYTFDWGGEYKEYLAARGADGGDHSADRPASSC